MLLSFKEPGQRFAVTTQQVGLFEDFAYLRCHQTSFTFDR